MNKWKLEYTIEYLTIENEIKIGDIIFRKEGKKTFAILEIESPSEEEAIKYSYFLLAKTINAMAAITKQSMNCTIKNVHQINGDSDIMQGSFYLPANVTVIRAFDHDNVDSVLELIELSNDLKVAWALELFNVDNQYTWVNMYRIYEVINSDANIIKHGWSTKKTVKDFTRTANSPQVLGKEARHGSSKEEPPKYPMSLEEAKEFINEIFNKWIKHKKECHFKELT